MAGYVNGPMFDNYSQETIDISREVVDNTTKLASDVSTVVGTYLGKPTSTEKNVLGSYVDHLTNNQRAKTFVVVTIGAAILYGAYRATSYIYDKVCGRRPQRVQRVNNPAPPTMTITLADGQQLPVTGGRVTLTGLNIRNISAT